jgi:hypothetical protein
VEDRPLPSGVHRHDGEVACGTVDPLVIDRQNAKRLNVDVFDFPMRSSYLNRSVLVWRCACSAMP